MSDKTKFTKVESSDSPRRVDMPKTPDSKTQPSNKGFGDERDGNFNGFMHPFNEEQKITNTKGSSYQDFAGGISDNFSQKDDNIEALNKRGQQGQMVQRWDHTKRTSMDTRGAGLTAYNSEPIPETYKCATSNGEPDANAVQYKTDIKDRNP